MSQELSEKINEQIEHANPSSLLNNWIAITVSICATFVAIINIKDNNIVQAMSQAQAHAIDSWSYFQAKSTKEHLTENLKNTLEMELMISKSLSEDQKNKIQTLIKSNQEKIQAYEIEKQKIKSDAEGFQKEYDSLNVFDDQFDMSEALFSLAMAIFGLSALTQKKKLFAFGLAMASFGFIFALAGFLAWPIHPEWLARLLS